jgi:MFS family permease
VLGVTSFLTDVSSEIIFPLFAPFTTEVLGASAAALGLIEGLAESAASLFRVASGWWSDKLGRRKPFVVSGYGLSTAVKPALAAATSWPHALAVRFADRAGKGVRTAPRDVIISVSSKRSVRGKAFGLHRTLDTLGAVLGPVLAFLLLPIFGYRGVFLIAALPAVVAVIVLIIFVREIRGTKRIRISFISGVRSIEPEFRLYLAIATIFALGNFSWAFLVLRANALGIATGLTPLKAAGVVALLYAFSNLIYAIASTPSGILSDRIGRRPVLSLGYGVFGITCVGFAIASTTWHAILLFATYGLFRGITDGVQKAYISDLVVPKLRGTAMGTFDSVVGIAAFPASFIAGIIWSAVSPQAAFAYGAVLSFTAALFMTTALRKSDS